MARAFVDPGRMRLAGHDSSSAAVLAEGTNRIAGAIGASGLGDDASSLMAASVLGNYDLPENIDTSFIASGMAHLMCVSGFHVAVVAALIMALLWPLRLWGSRGRWRFLLAVGSMWSPRGSVPRRCVRRQCFRWLWLPASFSGSRRCSTVWPWLWSLCWP